jgi:hypothetical protein
MAYKGWWQIAPSLLNHCVFCNSCRPLGQSKLDVRLRPSHALPCTPADERTKRAARPWRRRGRRSSSLKKFWHRQGRYHARACTGMHRRTRAELPISRGTTTPSPRTVRLARRARVLRQRASVPVRGERGRGSYGAIINRDRREAI